MKRYLPWADQIRVGALVCVVVLHVAAVYIVGWSVYPLVWWQLANAVDSAARVAVPLFVMLSGALLLPQTESFKTFYSKRAIRVVVPWLFWASLGFCYQLLVDGSVLLVKNPAARIFHAYVTSYWYVVLLLVLYLVTPWLRVVVKKITSKHLWMGVGTLFLVSSGLSLWIELFNHPRLVQLAWLLAFLGYYFSGYLIRKSFEQNKLASHTKVLSLLFLASWLVTLFGTFELTNFHGRFMQLFYDYGFAAVIVQGLTAFSLVMIASKKVNSYLVKHRWQENIKDISQLSYGIFLTQSFVSVFLLRQPMVVSLLSWLHPLVFIPVIAAVTFVLCYGLVKAISKIPVMRLVV